MEINDFADARAKAQEDIGNVAEQIKKVGKAIRSYAYSIFCLFSANLCLRCKAVDLWPRGYSIDGLCIFT